MATNLQGRRGRMLNADTAAASDCRRSRFSIWSGEGLMSSKLRSVILPALLIAFVCNGVNASYQRDCLSYEPTIVHLTGRIVRKVFPGRPGYESIKHGDEPEEAWLLHLDRPICMKADEKSELNNEAEAHVSNIHLVLRPHQFRELRKVMKKGKVTLGGSLFHSFTGHHHARVLMSVSSINGK